MLCDNAAPTPRDGVIRSVLFAFACSFAGLVAPSWANAGELPTLNPVVYDALRSVAGSYRYALDCTYAPKGAGAEGLAFPPQRGLRAQVFVRPWICASANRVASGRWDASSGTAAMALLVLTHEAVHVSPFAGARVEHLTECRALVLFPLLLAALNAPGQVVPAFVSWASAAHELLLASDPQLYGPTC
jgi:hypothetical protein